MARNYYCLVAGLPDLLMEDRKMALSSLNLREMLQEDLHPQDYRLLSLFFFKYDHNNIIAKLFNTPAEFDKRGIFSSVKFLTLHLLLENCSKFESLKLKGVDKIPFEELEKCLTIINKYLTQETFYVGL